MLSVLGSIFSTAFSLPLPLPLQSEVLEDEPAAVAIKGDVEERDIFAIPGRG
jgi:hypothetical protein